MTTRLGDEHEADPDAIVEALLLRAAEAKSAQFDRNELKRLVVDQPREAIRRLLGSIGHDVHYGYSVDLDQPETWLSALFEQLIATLRSAKDHGTGDLLPGDLVEVAVDRLPDQLRAGTVMRVYFVGDDGTADVGFESLVDEYVIYTVDVAQLRRRTGDASAHVS